MNQLLAAKQTKLAAQPALQQKIDAEVARIQNGLSLWQSLVSFAYDCSDYEGKAKLEAIDLAIDSAGVLRQKANNVVIS